MNINQTIQEDLSKNLDVPKENAGSKLFGSFMHIGPPLMFSIALLLMSWNLTNIIVSFLSISFFFTAIIIFIEQKRPNVELPDLKIKEVSVGMSLVFLKGVLIGGSVVIAMWYLLNLIPIRATLSQNWALIILAVFLTDLAYYGSHRYLNHGKGRSKLAKWYKKNHALHHSVTELDFLRGNISSLIDTAITGFQIPLGVIAFVLGLDLYATLIAYGFVLMLQGTHHVNYTFNIGALKYLFMDNHAHKLHHCRRGSLINHGALFSIWDRLGGTYYENWELSSNYLHANDIALPIKKVRNNPKVALG